MAYGTTRSDVLDLGKGTWNQTQRMYGTSKGRTVEAEKSIFMSPGTLTKNHANRCPGKASERVIERSGNFATCFHCLVLSNWACVSGVKMCIYPHDILESCTNLVLGFSFRIPIMFKC